MTMKPAAIQRFVDDAISATGVEFISFKKLSSLALAILAARDFGEDDLEVLSEKLQNAFDKYVAPYDMRLVPNIIETQLDNALRAMIPTIVHYTYATLTAEEGNEPYLDLVQQEVSIDQPIELESIVDIDISPFAELEFRANESTVAVYSRGTKDVTDPEKVSGVVETLNALSDAMNDPEAELLVTVGQEPDEEESTL